MAFKMNYSFEGKSKNRPEQNLSGASKKLTRDILLERTYEERRKRQELRLQLQSANLLQSYIRSYLVRKSKKQEQRQLFDILENSSVEVLLPKLLFFYDFPLDRLRMLKIGNQLLENYQDILKYIQVKPTFSWLIKRFLVLCLKDSEDIETNKKLMLILYLFSNDSGTIEYLIKKGYYEYLRCHLENNDNERDKILALIHQPFKFLNEINSLKELVIPEFIRVFLKPILTYHIKDILIPYLRNTCNDFPFRQMINYLNSGFYMESSSNLLYCVLALEPDNCAPNREIMKVLSILSRGMPEWKISLQYNESDDEDTEETDITHPLLVDCLNILNKPERAWKLLHFLECNINDESVLKSVVHFCHNLLLSYKDSMRKYLLLYKMGLNSILLKVLWKNIDNNLAIQLQTRGSNLNSWNDCHTTLSVFCSLFTFYTETLTDRENSDTSETFLSNDLYRMSQLLKKVSKDLIEVAFPLCRSSAISTSPEVLHLYRVCLNCLKVLYNLDMRKNFCLAGFWTAEKIHVSSDLARNDYLSKSILPFYGLINEEDDGSHLPPLSTIEQRSLAILKDLPFLITFNTRFLLLRDLCRYSLGGNDYQRLHHELLHDNVIVIRRSHLYEDAFEKMSVRNVADLKHKIRIQFINAVGLEEAGIDGGGIFKEFINEVLKTAFDPNRGFFLMTADNTLYPNPNVHLITERFTEHYFFIGRLIGKAIFENVLVDLPLAEFFLAKLLINRSSAHYLRSLDPVLYRNLLYLRDYKGDITDLGLDFTTVNHDLGETRIIELKANGANIAVTNENRLEYIQRLADLKLNTQLEKQCDAFRNGLNSVIPLTWLKLFSHKELQVIIGGDNQDIDLSDLTAHTVYGGEFTLDHPTIILFWKILHRFTDVQKKQLLKFVTSCSRPPLLGFKELNPQFCIQSSGTENRMPTASTCLNLLKLPIISDEESLRNKLLEAIEQQAGFELS